MGEEGGGVLKSGMAVVVWARRREGVLDIVHGHSGMTVDACIPIMPGRSLSEYYQADTACTNREAP